MVFWKKKKKPAPKKDAPATNREAIIAQARANAAAAREEIGDETLEKIREALMRKENDPLEQAKAKVRAMDKQKVADSVSDWLREGKDD